MTDRDEKEVISFLNRDVERKSLDRSAARDELAKKEEEESKENDE